MPNKSHSKHRYTCPHCGAIYEVSTGRSKPAYRTATCSYCGDVMAEWEGPTRHYHRIKRPRSATQVAKIVAEVAAAGGAERRPRQSARGKGNLVASRKPSAPYRRKRVAAR